MSLRALYALLLTICAPANALIGGDCTWRDPGREPYTGSVTDAIMSFDHIRYDQRLLLSLMVRHRPPVDVVAIGRETVTGSRHFSYDRGVNGMHFGRGRVCGTVTRDGWAADQIEIARVWCLDRWCIVIPDVCGNVAWTVRYPLASEVMHKATHAVPEPGALWLVLAGLGAAIFIGRRSRP